MSSDLTGGFSVHGAEPGLSLGAGEPAGGGCPATPGRGVPAAWPLPARRWVRSHVTQVLPEGARWGAPPARAAKGHQKGVRVASSPDPQPRWTAGETEARVGECAIVSTEWVARPLCPAGKLRPGKVRRPVDSARIWFLHSIPIAARLLHAYIHPSHPLTHPSNPASPYGTACYGQGQCWSEG